MGVVILDLSLFPQTIKETVFHWAPKVMEMKYDKDIKKEKEEGKFLKVGKKKIKRARKKI